MDTGKTSRYLKYAIGEIALVVIGILIALQINNWNENRKERQEEFKILKAIKVGLEADLQDLKYNAVAMRQSIAAGNKAIEVLENNQPHNDSIPDYIGLAMFPVKFLYSTSAFETLKSKGIDLIENPKVRDAIVSVYDSGYTFFIDTERTITLDAAEYGLVNVFPTRFEESYVFNFDKPGYEPRLMPLDFQSLKQDQEFMYFFKSYVNRLDIFLKFHYNTKIIPQVENLITVVNEEINRLEN